MKPSQPRKLFVNFAVRDLQRSMGFFRELGFEFNPQFCDDTAACMLIGEDAFAMLVTDPRFREFTHKPPADTSKSTETILAITAESRAAVDTFAERAQSLGATPAKDPQDHGFMFVRSFHDLDGHMWEIFWMDPAAIPSA